VGRSRVIRAHDDDKDYKGNLSIVKAQALSGIQIGELITAGIPF
jgi:hypothetical protein